MNCPSTVQIEEGDGAVITCTSKTPFVDVYWFIGPTSSTDPILWLQNGKKGGTQYGNTHYDLTLRGEMVIKSANVDNAATYTIVAYFEDGTSEQANVTVLITSTPTPSCLEISNCLGCEGCSLNISEPGFLTCSKNEVRPQLQVDWRIESRDRIEFTHHQPIAIYDDESDSWNVSAKIAYEVKGCGGSAILRCFVQNQDQSTNGSLNTIRLFTEPCIIENDLDPEESAVVAIICFAVIIPIVIIIVIVAGILFIVYYQKKKKQNRGKRERGKENYETGVALLPPHDDTRECVPDKKGDTQVNPQPKKVKSYPEDKEKKRNILVLELKRYYKTCVDKISLPGKHPPAAASFYTHSQCLVTKVTREDEINEPESHTTDELPNLDCIKKAKLIRLFGKAGYGKTTFAHHLLRQWVAEDAHETIMIFLDMKTLEMEADFLNCVLKVVSDQSNLNRADIDNILLEYPFFVLLDGCNEMAMLTNQNNVTEDTENPSNSGAVSLRSSREDMFKDGLKMKGFYRGNANAKYPDLRMCMMARDTIQKKPLLPCPSVSIKLLGFSSQQTDKYIDNFCEQWIESNSREGRSHTRDENSKEGNTGNTRVAENAEDFKGHHFARKIKFQLNEILGETGILHEFGKIPLLLTAVTYIVAHDGTNNDNMKEQSEGRNISLTAGLENMQPQETKLPALLGRIVKFLESKYSDDNGKISEKLAEIALHNKTQIYPYEVRDKWETVLGIDKMETALSAGFLEEDNILTNRSVINVIKFSHNVFADYFAASYFPVEKKGLDTLTALIKDNKDDKENMIFQHLCASNHPLIYKLVEYFAEYKMINNFINCLYEVEYPDKLELFRARIQNWKEQKNIIIRHTNFYYQKTLKNFLNLCTQWKIKLKTLTLEGFPVSFLVSLTLPDLKQLEISHTDLSKNGDFEHITAWLTQQSISSLCKFIDCSMLDTLSEQSLRHMADPNCCHIERVDNEQVSKPNAKTLRWKGKGSE